MTCNGPMVLLVLPECIHHHLRSGKLKAESGPTKKVKVGGIPFTARPTLTV